MALLALHPLPDDPTLASSHAQGLGVVDPLLTLALGREPVVVPRHWSDEQADAEQQRRDRDAQEEHGAGQLDVSVERDDQGSDGPDHRQVPELEPPH